MVKIGLKGHSFGEIKAFYDSVDYSGVFLPSDLTLVASEDCAIIGVVRLCTEHDHLVLRGMEIIPDRQRQGLGSEMLRQLVPYIGQRPCWGIALSHLGGFYAQASFRFDTNGAAVPKHLLARLDSYNARNRARNTGKTNVVMYRPSI
jgi:GNAT superfamily N-acetyltransferase